MNDDKRIIDLMQKNISCLKKGTLRFWGEWFGRPMDNYHIIVNVNFNTQENILIFKFDEDEMLIIWNPVDIISDSSEFYIRSATKIRWEWYSYGRPKTHQNLYYNQYEKLDNSIFMSSGKGTLENIGKKVIDAKGYYAVEIC